VDARPGDFPNLGQGTGIALVYLALSTWLGSLVEVAATTFTLPAWLSMVPGLVLGFPLTLAFGLWLGRLDLWDILAFRRVRPGVWLPLLITHAGFLILILALAHGLEAALDRLPAPFHQSLLEGTRPQAEASGPMLALVFALAAVPEEILFRGLILRGLLRRHRPGAAIWLSTGLFVIAHGNPLQFPVALMIGACAGWYYQATGSLWPGFAAHALHNLAVGLVLEPDRLQAGSLAIHPLPAWPWLLAAPLLAGAGLAWLRWEFRRPEPAREGRLDWDGTPGA
jgi:membrane protease YdiL (CAAX protease family)